MDKPTRAEEEMLDGYLDGFDPDSPRPSGNRSAAYVHGFENALRDRGIMQAEKAEVLRRRAEMIIETDKLENTNGS